jgi:hypothetical protein
LGEEALKEALASVVENLKERASSPILGYYTAATLAYNWKPIVVLFTSESKGTALTDEIAKFLPGATQSLLYPFIFAVAFSVVYPSLRAAVATLNTTAQIWELRAELRLAEWRELLANKRSDVETVISSINELAATDNIGYHDLKRIVDALPNPDDLKIDAYQHLKKALDSIADPDPTI